MLVIVVIILLPSSLGLRAETNNRSVGIALGIDRINENQLEVSVEIIVPKLETTYRQNAQIISAVGENTTQALEELSLHIGRVVGLSHCGAVIIGESLKNENIIEIIDHIFRSKRVNYNAELIYTKGSAKELLQNAVKIDEIYVQNINQILSFNNNFIISQNLYISDFYKNYYDNHGACFVPVISMESESYLGLSTENVSSQSSGQQVGSSNTNQMQQSGNSSQGGESGGEQSGQSVQSGGQQGGLQQASEQSTSKKIFANNGEVAVFKNGKFIKILSPKDIRGFGLILNDSIRGALKAENINDGIYNNATLSFSIRNNIITSKVGFSKNNIPQIAYTMNLTLSLEQIDNKVKNSLLTDDVEYRIAGVVKEKLEQQVKEYCSQAINECKTSNLDLLHIFDKFNRFEYDKWQKYLKSLDDPDNYINGVEFYMQVNIISYN